MTTEEMEAFELKQKAEVQLNPGCFIDLLCTIKKVDLINLYIYLKN